MLPQNDYLIQRDYLDYHTEALLEDARQRRLLHNAGIVPKLVVMPGIPGRRGGWDTCW